MVQFGINGDPEVNRKWRRSNIKDDPVKESNKPGYITFADVGAELALDASVHQLCRQ